MNAEAFPLTKTRSRAKVVKAPRVEDPKHLAYIAGLPCVVPGCHRRSTVHHLRCQGSRAAAGRRAGDDESIPACWEHHQGDTGVHKIGERAFWRALGVDPLALAARLWAESHGKEMP